ncbi:metallophosphoesterase family protein [Brevibacterium casei]|uniref:Nuclease SbcCD subunit D n=2 Tax=Brevibacterium casei TaxID=33889 RepID=K9AP16_9MICO|nr:metallophosphoesterase [Brevibacterium casei]EKU49153.1 Ser/Thr phosphatase domain protein [Brevibacterium casei S18]MCT1445668.1 metallophosphoesterase [Brevibacterium casei]MCT1549891.1 metallophosphoesterase [Brevibacterium casei]MCT1558785.1 metallophosphoesterase [Brevibacterium casei]MCT1764745.1 metallophosphoesterase [Brevibacterium casei]
MRFIATGDWQLGMTAHFLSAEARPRFHRARLDAIRRIGQLAEERGAEFVLVCGDVFESNQLDRAIVSRSFEVLSAFTVPVVLLPGNHDPLDAASIYDSPAFTSRQPEQVRVLRDSAPVEVLPGTEVVGAPWFSKRPLHDLVAAATDDLAEVAPGRIRIIAGHGAVSSLDPDRESVATIDEANLRRVVDADRAQFVALGDRHATYEVAERIWYPGAPEVTSRREDDPGNVLVVDIDPQTHAVDVEKVAVGQWSFVVVEEDIDSGEDVTALESRLAAIADKDRTAVWLILRGTLSTAAKARLDEVLDHAGDLFALVSLWERHTDLAVIAADEDFAGLGLSGYLQESLDDLAERAAGDDAAAQDALGLLYRFARSGT